MPLTYAQALSCDEFHEGDCVCHIGPRGGKKFRSVVWRRNGRTQTWKTRPGHYAIPVKYGLKECGRITHSYAKHFHADEDCPLRNGGNDGAQ